MGSGLRTATVMVAILVAIMAATAEAVPGGGAIETLARFGDTAWRERDAAPPGDDAWRGQELARRHCIECHATGDAVVFAQLPPVPPLGTYSNRDYEREALTLILLTRGHPASLHKVLSVDKLDAIDAHIRSLSHR